MVSLGWLAGSEGLLLMAIHSFNQSASVARVYFAEMAGRKDAWNEMDNGLLNAEWGYSKEDSAA